MRTLFRLSALVVIFAAGNAMAQADGSLRPDPPAPADDSPVQVAGEAEPADKSGPARNPAFYNTEVAVASQNANERRGALARAFDQVIVRLTGDPLAPRNALIRRAAGNAKSLASDTRYRQDTEHVNGVPVYKTVLVVNFEPNSVDELIAGAGLKYWSSDRPRPILWLAIDDGRGARLVGSQQINVVKPLARRGLERGMHYGLPTGGTVEQAAVGAIWAQDAAALRLLSARYGNDCQLIGKVYRSPAGWTADWLLTRAGAELARWSFSDADAQRVIASGVDKGADALAVRDAVLLDSEPAGLYRVDVLGVEQSSDFIRAMAYLQTLAVVRKVGVIEARPEYLRLQLDLGTGMKGFRRMVEVGDTLRPVSGEAEQAAGAKTRTAADSVARFELR